MLEKFQPNLMSSNGRSWKIVKNPPQEPQISAPNFLWLKSRSTIPQEPQTFFYLRVEGTSNFDLRVEALYQPRSTFTTPINNRYMYNLTRVFYRISSETEVQLKECHPHCACRSYICWRWSITQLDVRRMYILDINQRHVSANSWPARNRGRDNIHDSTHM